jgi:hypothetical protein
MSEAEELQGINRPMTTLVTRTTWPGRILSAGDPAGGDSPEAMSRRILARTSP